MGKKNFVLICFGLLFIFPAFAHADGGTDQYLNYDVLVRGFYWAANTVTASTPSAGTAGYGGTVDVKFKQGSGMANWGFGAEFTSTPNGPRDVNTGGAYETSYNGQAGTPVSLGGGAFGLVVPGTFQMGGAHVAYFFPTTNKDVNFGIYGNYLSITGGRSAIGGGAEMSWDIGSNWNAGGFLDWDNVTGNSYPTQTLIRYQATFGYNIPNSQMQVFAGYRGENFTGFYKTFITGFMAGLGAHF